MAYTQCFFQQHALTIPVRASPQRQVVSTKRKHIVCKAEKEDVEEGDANTLSLVSRRSALTAIVGGAGAAGGGTQLLPAHAAVVADVADAQFSRDSALTTLSSAETPASVIQTTSFNRNSFPPGFVFGSASSAYQFEGAANEGGRAPSTWDYFTHNYPEKIRDRSNGDVAVDHYHRFKEDIQIMKEMNLDAYRFSISWSRLLPTGKVSGGINQEGIKFYNKIIDELLANGIQPYVTIFHWDASLALEQEYKGFLSRQIVDDYRDYAELCFREFGDRVKHWITVNEPYVFSVYGYANGAFAPGRCSEWLNPTCLGGDSGVEPYIVAHNILLAHAEAVNVYRKKYQDSQKGVIGITLISHWFEPYSESKADKEATSRAIDFMIGWYMEPVTSGKYPACMRELVGDRLPKFTAEEAKLVAGSFDFIGVNYYTTYYAAHASRTKPNYMTDADVEFKTERDGIPIGPQFGPSWLFVVPRGIGELLQHIDKTYNHPVVYITENGLGEILSSPDLPVEEALIDTYRIDYYYRHLYYVNKAISAGVKVKGYFAWSLLDNFEWADGFVVRFGLNFVDYKDNLKRYAKLSAVWFKSFLQKTVKKLYY